MVYFRCLPDNCISPFRWLAMQQKATFCDWYSWSVAFVVFYRRANRHNFQSTMGQLKLCQLSTIRLSRLPQSLLGIGQHWIPQLYRISVCISIPYPDSMQKTTGIVSFHSHAETFTIIVGIKDSFSASSSASLKRDYHTCPEGGQHWIPQFNGDEAFFKY